MQKLVKRIELSMEYVDTDIPTAEIRSPEDAARICQSIIGRKDRENFLVLMLNTKNVVVGYHIAAVGTLNVCPAAPREIFKAAILCNSASVILCHNHPSGNTSSSKEDRQITEQLIEAGKILNIPVLDNLIVSHNEFSSTMHNVTREILPRVAETSAALNIQTIPIARNKQSANAAIVEAALANRGCSCKPYQDVFTYRQWLNAGYVVKKGEHGIKIKTIREVEEEGKKVRKPWTAVVFCRCQVKRVQ